MHIGGQNENQAKYIKYNSWQSKGIKHRALTKTQFIVHELVPLLTRGIAHFTRTEILYGRRFTLSRYFTIGACRRMGEEDDSISPGRHVRVLRQCLSGEHLQPTIQILRILHSRRLSPTGRGGRFNFPGQTCPDPPAMLIRRTSATNDSNSPDSLARQTLTTHSIKTEANMKWAFTK